MKGQGVRTLDVFVIMPMMIWGGAIVYPRNKLLGAALVGTGVLTGIYNAKNWLTVEAQLEAQRAAQRQAQQPPAPPAGPGATPSSTIAPAGIETEIRERWRVQDAKRER